MKNIVFVICAILIFAIGAFAFKAIEKRVEDRNWIVVAVKLLVAFALFILFVFISVKTANHFNITWEYPSF